MTTGSGRCARVANRPILRVLEDGTTVVAQSGESAADHDLKGTLTFLAGSPGQGFGSPSDMNAGFAVERSLLSSGTLRFNGNLGYGTDGQGIPAVVLRSTYTNRFNGVFEPSLAITALRLNSPDLHTMPGATLQALSVTSSDRVVLGDRLEMKLGSELQAIQFMGRVKHLQALSDRSICISRRTPCWNINTRVQSRIWDWRVGWAMILPATMAWSRHPRT